MEEEMKSCLLQPKDRDYNKHGGKREPHIEQKDDGLSHNLRTGGQTMVTNNVRIRKLTPRECWRLMGFEDEDYEKAQEVNSDTQLYKQAGNSIVVQVLQAIFGEMV